MSATATARPLTGPATLLRRVLLLDAAVTGVNALAYLAVSGPLADLLGVSRALLLELGVFLLAYAAAVGYLAARPSPPALGVKAVVEANVAWTVLSVLALGLWLEPTTAGAVWTVLQAVTVLGFAGLQTVALRGALRA
ncbi:hypothetical protein SRB5_26640 [Streptomyces sp. RB5]|uniref:Integral membrane protein n=1 Tax=Streptomyces smaragdinus TaxID=2585196 RepID=A0A7K0CGD0_9ACTN|nr:hypothetical protein [Streptomyces smaragdinus]MQY12529.1 hypothetical protein [Streptomyces smaragdinus]